jgi:anti-sigma B factor antagonist
VDVQLRQSGTVTVVDLSGKVTLGQGDEALLARVSELLEVAGTKRLLINLDQVPYMDSAGIGALVQCYKRAEEHDATLKLLNPRRRVYDLLHVVKLDSVFQCFTDEQQAIASFAP